MKTLKIYSIVATLAITGLSIWIYLLQKVAKEIEEVQLQCSDRYYKEISISK